MILLKRISAILLFVIYVTCLFKVNWINPEYNTPTQIMLSAAFLLFLLATCFLYGNKKGFLIFAVIYCSLIIISLLIILSINTALPETSLLLRIIIGVPVLSLSIPLSPIMDLISFGKSDLQTIIPTAFIIILILISCFAGKLFNKKIGKKTVETLNH